MLNKRRGLGKGLNALLSATLDTATAIAPDSLHSSQALSSGALAHDVSSALKGELLYQIPTEKLKPGRFQPRQHIQDDGLEELAESIRGQGILQPIVVRKHQEDYEIIAGERRWRAAQLAGLSTVPVIVRDMPDEAAMAVALIENIQRENLSPLEEAFALKRLSEELGLTHLQVAEAIGKSRTSVTNMLRLLTLDRDIQQLLEEGKMEMGHARALLGLEEHQRAAAAQKIVSEGLSVRQAEKLVFQLKEGDDEQPSLDTKPSIRRIATDPNIRQLENNLAEKLCAKVSIRHGSKGKGMLIIRYHNVDELEGILTHFN